MINDDKTEFLLVGLQKQLAKVSVVCFAEWSMKTLQKGQCWYFCHRST